MEVTINLNKPHPAQRQILDCKARFITLMAGRRFGKSLISQHISIKRAVRGERIAYITPTYSLGKTFFKELIKTLPQSVFTKNEQDLTIDFITKGQIRFFTGERLDGLRGLKFHLVILDEASFTDDLEEGWNNAIRPTLTDFKGSALFISTPKGKNFFYSCYLKGVNKDEGWASFKFTTYDNPYIDSSEIDEAKRHLPHTVFEQEYMANPSENKENPFGLTAINWCIQPISTLPTAYYGIDLAKSVDYTVIIGLDRQGVVTEFQRFQKDWKGTKETILSLNRRTPIYIDSTGVGDSIVEDLQQEFYNMTGFKFSSTSKQQLMEALSSAIHNKNIGYPDGAIVKELEMFEYTYTSTGVKYSAPSGFHDDCVCALALANKCKMANFNSGKYTVL